MLVKFLRWSVSESGRNTMSYIATAGIGTVGFFHFVPHTFLIEQYVDLLHHYRRGLTVPVTDETIEKVQTVLDMLEVPTDEKLLFKPFNVAGFDIKSIGSAFSHYGVRIGIPGNFEFEKESDIDTSRITLNGEKVIWGTEAGQKYLKSLIISKNAQLYAIAKEVKLRQTPKLYIDTVAGILSAFTAYAGARAINQKLNFYVKPFLFRFFVYALVSSFSLGNYFLVKDLTQVYYEQRIDKELKSKNEIFAEGGKDYYTKLLLRNMCLRIMLGKDGESLFSPLGNENNFIRTKSTPLMQRREFFE